MKSTYFIFCKFPRPSPKLFGENRRRLKTNEERQSRLLDAIEQGIAALDEITKERLQKLKSARDALQIQIAEARIAPMPAAIEYLKPSQVDLFGKALRNKLLGKSSALVKGYFEADGG